ncbi:MAG: ABC transporter ATP-binding protein, partial [Clostridia bacterium]
AYIHDKIKYALKLVDLEGYEDRHPMSLSGGQQQRIAIARAIVNEPKVLLLDEPLGALDLKLRQDMQKELIKIKNELGITFVFVTHDQEEALTMSDRIIVMNQGLIQQIGTPVDIYNEPENAFVADFIGESNIIDGVMPKDFLVEILGIPFPCVDSGFGRNELVDVVIRPEDMEFQEPGSGMLDGRVTSILFKGVHYEMKVQAGGFEWLAHSTEAYHPGTEVGIYVKPENIQIMHKPTSAAQEVINTNE